MLNEQKNLIVDLFVHQYVIESSNFANRLGVISDRRCPFGWPIWETAVAYHQRVIAQHHAGPKVSIKDTDVKKTTKDEKME